MLVGTQPYIKAPYTVFIHPKEMVNDEKNILPWPAFFSIWRPTAALHSVFPVTELGAFMSLVKMDKEQQLNELTMIVTGICLFNKFNKKGGEGIDDCEFAVHSIQ